MAGCEALFGPSACGFCMTGCTWHSGTTQEDRLTIYVGMCVCGTICRCLYNVLRAKVPAASERDTYVVGREFRLLCAGTVIL